MARPPPPAPAPPPRPLPAQRHAFFQRVRDLGESIGTVVRSWPSPSAQDAVDVNIGVPGCIVVLSLSSREPAGVRCSFYIRDDKALFAQLHVRREEIEDALGATLEWLENPEYKASKAMLRHDGDWREESLAPGLAQWLVSTAEVFATVFTKYVSEVRGLT